MEKKRKLNDGKSITLKKDGDNLALVDDPKMKAQS